MPGSDERKNEIKNHTEILLCKNGKKEKKSDIFLQKPTKADDLGSGWVSLEILFSDGDIRDTESEIRASSSAGSDGSSAFLQDENRHSTESNHYRLIQTCKC